MSAQFLLLAAFSNSRGGGNPAAVVFTDMNLPNDTFMDVAQNFNQPVTAFVSDLPLPANKPRTVAFGIRWCSTSREYIALCGHGTMAAAKAVFARDDVPGDTEVVEFHTQSRGIVSARKRQRGFIEIELPAATISEVSPDEFVRISAVVNRTCGRNLDIKHIARESGFSTNIITSECSNGQERFISRMIAPGLVPGDEDAVCGSAHCLMVPYWCKQFGLAIGQEMRARQVSARGGELKLVWRPDMSTVKLAGEVVILGKGEVRLT
ncbi:hypothetical protein DXG01_009760 [Tephrocybe rancida]|nr:hypothetical protein DXG01_009760 [Tephrocybe rancida]